VEQRLMFGLIQEEIKLILAEYDFHKFDTYCGGDIFLSINNLFVISLTIYNFAIPKKKKITPLYIDIKVILKLFTCFLNGTLNQYSILLNFWKT